ncbi:hypothetical protein BO85DRAFT_454142 [Aspergillus piperis CBS 112811]|uniref:Uncharacterized protein n=1 Tax=Aspergillus piperis CBS 112811 TaxID=1448313 RepID=A0A8G1QR20_9EURO|nr:hypothetical protein BO85DRAFT_454142 [Aspergillus piperis CBS 112811]RAH52243.1 hypothetical protein BO85DRAFT_454142 [Aspergillus piperis CBS 112811]
MMGQGFCLWGLGNREPEAALSGTQRVLFSCGVWILSGSPPSLRQNCRFQSDRAEPYHDRASVSPGVGVTWPV